ncbi:MAG: UDP-glucose 4-epimerase GalE [Alphaproteobacteria bacterium]|jgi:UDP-arabinose 4-epimerase|nr:UDP-glucose 4-epimerase GalE [Rhodospirillales bacterium]MDP6591405.1 UDP-glucose 4-epimerase GalE [Alphaproteobacteria bacterium]MDP6817126.1 UDP-glucose 4-epimerase GalE [Alphaproteobacteria bacterium]
MATVLVTGGAGYIGSHACKALEAAGHLPVVYDNLENGHEWAVQWGPFEKGDIRERARLDAVIARHRPDAVMHFAGYIEVADSVRDPLRFYRNNVAGSLVLLQAMHAASVAQIVFSSSCAVYGAPDMVPISEDTAFAPISPYARSKLAMEYMLEDCRTAHGLSYAALRYFNAAGADSQARIGESHSPETHALPLLIDTALGRRKHFSIFGSDYPTADGTAIRDYIHVDDLAAAHVLALEHLLAAEDSLVLNLGTGTGVSVRELIDAVERVSGREVPVVDEARRPGDPPALVADPARARETLNWRPAYSEIEAIITTAWKWHAERN